MSMRTPSRATVLIVSCALLSACGGGTPPSAPAIATPPATASTAAAPPSAATEAAKHIASANAAFAAGRFVSPAEDNALAWLAAARDADADHPGAVEALVDLYPIALAAAERAIVAGDPGDARRILDLLDRVQPDSLGTRGLRERLPSAVDAAQPAAAVAPPAPAEPPASRVAEERSAPAQPPAVDEPATAPARDDTDPAAAAVAPASPARATEATIAPTVAPASPTPATEATPAPAAAVAIEPPRVRARVEPAYPQLARQRRIEGWVELDFLVAVDGTPTDIRVVESSPNAIFDGAATRALQRWRFDPARRGDNPEPARTRTRITFRLG